MKTYWARLKSKAAWILLGFKAKGIKQTDTGQHLWSIYVCKKKRR